jgi:hypothetical protein
MFYCLLPAPTVLSFPSLFPLEVIMPLVCFLWFTIQFLSQAQAPTPTAGRAGSVAGGGGQLVEC